jgi:protein-tyrosine-phosphatase
VWVKRGGNARYEASLAACMPNICRSVFARQIYRRQIAASALQAMRIGNVGMLLNPLSCQTFSTHDMMS